MCKVFDELATKYDIAYVADSGTLLGIVRHGGFIAWDDDADVELLLGEEAKLANPELLRDLAIQGLKLVPHWGGWKLCPIEYPAFAHRYERGSDTSRWFCWPFVDIFVAKVDPEYPDRIIADVRANMVDVSYGDRWRETEYYTRDQLEGELTKMPFGPIALPVPKNPEAYLDRAYCNWRHEIRCSYDHRRDTSIDPPIVVSGLQFRPAPFDHAIFEAKERCTWPQRVFRLCESVMRSLARLQNECIFP
jgi:hypothetical protein